MLVNGNQNNVYNLPVGRLAGCFERVAASLVFLGPMVQFDSDVAMVVITHIETGSCVVHSHCGYH